jgi:hypothetical protein
MHNDQEKNTFQNTNICNGIFHISYFKALIINEGETTRYFWFTILAQHKTNDVILYIHSVHKHGEFFSTSKLQDEIKTEKFELNKFHASKKDPFY